MFAGNEARYEETGYVVCGFLPTKHGVLDVIAKRNSVIRIQTRVSVNIFSDAGLQLFFPVFSLQTAMKDIRLVSITYQWSHDPLRSFKVIRMFPILEVCTHCRRALNCRVILG